MTLPAFAALYDGLDTGWLAPEDLDPDLVAIQVWVRFADPCTLHPAGACHGVTVHEFAVDATSCLYVHCDPEGPVPPTTAEVAAVRFMWSDGRAEDIGPTQLPYLHPVLRRLQPS
jgi:hypothetical protein